MVCKSVLGTQFVCLYKRFVRWCLGSYFEAVAPVSEVSVVPFLGGGFFCKNVTSAYERKF